MQKSKPAVVWLLALLGLSSSAGVLAAPIYLNESNITVALGAGTTATNSHNTFDNGQTINKVIDAPSADAEEFHDQTTHIWFSGGALELLFDFQNIGFTASLSTDRCETDPDDPTCNTDPDPDPGPGPTPVPEPGSLGLLVLGLLGMRVLRRKRA